MKAFKMFIPLLFMLPFFILAETTVTKCDTQGNCKSKSFTLEDRPVVDTSKKDEPSRMGKSLLFSKKQKPKKKLGKRFELRLDSLKVGTCLRKYSGKEDIFYKIAELDRRSQKMYLVSEKESKPYLLERNYLFFNSEKFDRGMSIVDCQTTPNLYSDDYINKCTRKNRRSGTFYCEEEELYRN